MPFHIRNPWRKHVRSTLANSKGVPNHSGLASCEMNFELLNNEAAFQLLRQFVQPSLYSIRFDVQKRLAVRKSSGGDPKRGGP
jgi:hypothetical protein